jgi:hypothetical protein
LSLANEDTKYYLTRRLRGFCVYLIGVKDADEGRRRVLADYKMRVRGWIAEMEREEPYSDTPSAERHVILEIERLLEKNEPQAIRGRLSDLAAMIQARKDQQDAAARSSRWSILLTMIGLVLTLTFGGWAVYQYFSDKPRLPKEEEQSQKADSPLIDTDGRQTVKKTPAPAGHDNDALR